jgi:hypothetical protein
MRKIDYFTIALLLTCPTFLLPAKSEFLDKTAILANVLAAWSSNDPWP